MTVASVVGREFRLEVLEALIDEPVERLISALEAAIDAGLIREVEDDVDRFVFAHALVREALYEQQSASRRVRAHYAIAQALEALAPRFAVPPAELAHHYFESRHLDRDGQGDRLRRGGGRAGRGDALVGAGRAATTGARWRATSPAERRCELLLALGQRGGALRASGGARHVRARGDARAALGRPGRAGAGGARLRGPPRRGRDRGPRRDRAARGGAGRARRRGQRAGRARAGAARGLAALRGRVGAHVRR